LEKSPDELANLGKIIIASLKAMMAAGLGDEVEGMYSKVIERKPTNARNPFLCILDEYGYYAVPGFAVVPAQARSLGFSVVFAGQDLPAFQKASKEEAASIGANTNIKICMKLEDPLETWEFFMKSAGEAHVSVVSGFQTNTSAMTGQYMDSRNAQMEKRSRIDLLDLKEQREGEAHVFFKSRIVRAKMFYANPKPVKELRLNQFIKVDVPTDAVLRNLISGFESFKKMLQGGGKVFDKVTLTNNSANAVLELFSKSTSEDSIEKGIGVLLSYCERGSAPDVVKETVELPVSEFDIFTKLVVSEYIKSILAVDDIEQFSKPILTKTEELEKILSIESSLSKDRRGAEEMSSELIKDMQASTHYPMPVKDIPEAAELVSSIKTFIDSIVLS